MVTIQLVRARLQDASPEDNSIELDLFFTDEEIVYAMNRSAAAYNMLPPRGVDTVRGDRLPSDDSNIFLDGVLIQLYKGAIQKLSRNVVNWQSGDTTASIEKDRLELFRAAKSELEGEWKEYAQQRKIDINRNSAWGYY